jgi:hypothetical protein
LSQKVRHTFSGYAFAQLKRLEGHRKWLLNPPGHAPTVEEFGGELRNTDKGGQYNWFYYESNENAYKAALTTWQQYQEWLKNRNPKRAALEKKMGFDLKNAGHLVRLLLKAESILKTCDYNPVLTSEELALVQAVIEGQFSYAALIAWTNVYDVRVKSMGSDLPLSPDFNMVQDVLVAINKWTVQNYA